MTTIAELHEVCFELLLHSLHSQELAHSGYYCLENINSLGKTIWDDLSILTNGFIKFASKC